MRQDEFCYWLQGYFELTPGEKTSITLDQREIIRNHLELVKKCNVEGRKKTQKPITGFCAWLDGALDLAPVNDVAILPEAIGAIKNRLNAEFEHVIDPKVSGDKEELQAVHDGLQLSSPPNYPQSPQTYRC
jgi:hypothetical protein